MDTLTHCSDKPAALDVLLRHRGEALLTLEQARRRMNLSRSKLYLEIAAGRLEALKNGVRTYVREAEVDRYILNLPRA